VYTLVQFLSESLLRLTMHLVLQLAYVGLTPQTRADPPDRKGDCDQHWWRFEAEGAGARARLVAPSRFQIFIDFIYLLQTSLMSFVGSIAAFDKRSLKQQVTRVTNRAGQIYEEVRRSDGDAGVERVFVGQGVPQYLEDSMKGFSELECYFYHKDSRRWESAVKLGTKEFDPAFGELKLVTYNVWFSEKNWANRARKLLQIVQAEHADIICLQEVTQHFLDVVLEEEWIRSNYMVTDARGSTITPYGVLMIFRSSLKVFNSRLYELPTNMGRRFLLCDIQWKCGETLSIGTVHLESLNNSEIREAQLSRIFDVTSQASHLVIAGDFNFHHAMSENQALLRSSVDSWAAAPGGGRITSGRRGTLIDRVVHRSAAVRVAAARLIGCDPVVPPAADGPRASTSAATPNAAAAASAIAAAAAVMTADSLGRAQLDELYPSDHDGLVVEFELDPPPPPPPPPPPSAPPGMAGVEPPAAEGAGA
jgi:endonuclease/exonuclease/phosphatase family metal-dependent hydrolase